MQPLKDISIQFIKGVGPARKKLFQNLGVENVEDLFYLFPRRYEDRRRMIPIKSLKIGEFQTVSGKIVSQDARKTWYTKKHVSEIILDDGSGRLFCVWFNQPYLAHYFKAGRRVVVYGKVDIYKNRIQMVAPEYEIIEEEDAERLSIGRIVPIYPLTRGMTHRYIRKVVHNSLNKYGDHLQEILPVAVRNKYRLTNIKRSIRNIHFPETMGLQEEGHRRVSFEEFFLFQISVMKRRQSILQKPGVAHTIDEDMIGRFTRMFPFILTGAQKRAVREVASDMRTPVPMLRLLQGDVGSGKTVVALFGCLAAFNSGKQSAVMAPTEILALQHYENILGMLADSPFKAARTAILTSSLAKKEKETLYRKIAEGEVDLVIGTHALLSEGVNFKALSFVVMDEQHKFGVRQRALLPSKGTNPDVLVMTATPIPRTLSLTLFGDLDESVLDEMPPGRGKTETLLFPPGEEEEVYTRVRELAAQGQQVYIVYPIIEESETLDVKAAEAMFKHFQAHEFKGLRLGLVHGQMKRDRVEETMKKFKEKAIDILLATTVLEVGVDVPNANVMVIEHAERFGLSQLHQLRGRIGRGNADAKCFLIADAVTEEAQARLKAIISTTDGFKIAQQDLMIRGPGHYFGRHQHGLNELKVADPATQLDILEIARKEAQELVREDPNLQEAPHAVLARIIQERYPGYLENIEAG